MESLIATTQGGTLMISVPLPIFFGGCYKESAVKAHRSDIPAGRICAANVKDASPNLAPKSKSTLTGFLPHPINGNHMRET